MAAQAMAVLHAKRGSATSVDSHFPEKEPDGDDQSTASEMDALARLVPPEQREKQGTMMKQVISTKGLSWQQRTAVLSREHLSFIKVDDPSEQVMDFVPLHEIEKVSVQQVASDPWEVAKATEMARKSAELAGEGMDEREIEAYLANADPPIRPDAAAVFQVTARNR